MDNERFDALTRVFGRSGNRRSIIGAAVAVLSGAAAAPAMAQQTGEGEDCLRPGTMCDNNQAMWWRNDSCKLCCSGYPEPSGTGWRCACTPKGGGCGNSEACCDGEACYYGVCGGPACMPDGGECEAGGTPCCEGLYCDAYGWCKPDPNYVAPAPTPAPAAAPAASADPGTVPVDITFDDSTSTGATDSATTGTDTATSDPSVGSDTASAGEGATAPARECRPTGRGCTLPEQCCSGSCGADGNCA
jgi:hypothetical protein